MTIKFRVFKGADAQFYVSQVASNGEIVWQSEGYKRINAAFRLVEKTWRASFAGHGGFAPPPYRKDSLRPAT